MLGWLVRATVGTVVLGLIGYTVVMVPIGRRTLFEHGMQIFHTQPAQELVEDLHTEATHAIERVRTTLAKEQSATAPIAQQQAAAH
jgi:hypothetical protein